MHYFLFIRLSVIRFIVLLPLVTWVSAAEIDLQNGEEINELCAGCHGEYGEGDKHGEYPRLAGQPAGFTARQLHLFRDRSRPNIAMVEYIDERQMPDQDILDISYFLQGIKLKNRLSVVDENAHDFNAYARLLEAKKIVQIPRAEGDVEKGGELYRKECRSCHGSLGEGDLDEAVPMLAGQYTNYLWRQVEKYLQGVRIHDPQQPDERLLAEFSREELQDIFAYISLLDD
jgi:cytochrome c553